MAIRLNHQFQSVVPLVGDKGANVTKTNNEECRSLQQQVHEEVIICKEQVVDSTVQHIHPHNQLQNVYPACKIKLV